MINVPRPFLFTLLVSLSALTSAQDATSVVRRWLWKNHVSLGLTPRDAADWRVTSSSTDRKGVTYVYIEQIAHGLSVHGAVASFAVRSGEVVSFGGRLRGDVAGNAPAPSPTMGPLGSLRSAMEQLGLPAVASGVLSASSPNDLLLDGTGISHEPIPAHLTYEAIPNGRIALIWDLTIRSTNNINWWHLAVDGHTGEILRNNDHYTHCAWPSPGARAYRALDDLTLPASPLAPPPDGPAYRVFAYPTESPSHGPHTLVNDPADPLASPFGWHDLDGEEGPESTITRGNNVHAFEDIDNDDAPGYGPDGGNDLMFDFPYQPPQAPDEYLDAAITNLFYTCNVLHDVWYRYGFDEESGNFQSLNANGMGADNDAVIAQAQDGGGMNNANFGTPPDGESGRMQMYLWRAGTDSTLTINSPEPIAGTYVNALAGFGPPLPEEPLTADVVLVVDDLTPENDGCETITNGAAIAGNIALVDRGECTFISKVLALQAQGAEAVIVVNNVPGDPIAMGGSDGEDIVIPSVMISEADGETIKQALEDGPVNGTLQSISTEELRDSDFDNGIIAHEYGHGVSTRLTGGPADSDCLWNAEQMGEGWSDWMGMVLTIRPGDDGATIRGVGTFVRDQANDGPGIRPAPYSTDLAINDYTYAATNNDELSEPHGIGFVWATMLWDLNWALIEAHGYDPDVYNGNGGNNMAIQLMMDGLKLQPCSPGFIDGRNAILRADTLNFGAENACLIWNVFAQRGLGFSADQGDPYSRYDQTESFDMPAGCSVGLDEDIAGRGSTLSLMPNPANDQVTLVLDRATRRETVLSIRGTDGRSIHSQRWPAGVVRQDLDLSGFAPAVYIVVVRSANGTSQARLVKN